MMPFWWDTEGPTHNRCHFTAIDIICRRITWILKSSVVKYGPRYLGTIFRPMMISCQIKEDIKKYVRSTFPDVKPVRPILTDHCLNHIFQKLLWSLDSKNIDRHFIEWQYICASSAEYGMITFVDLHIIRALRWRHNGRDSVSYHQPHDCLLNRLFRRRSKKTSKLRVTGLCVGNPSGTG